jgi:heptose-I-phosphate ethanolaminephosphotransferase
VPFILWTSAKWNAQDASGNDVADLHRPYSTSHFIHTWSDLAGLRYEEFDPTKSLVNAEFQQRPLLIGNPHKPSSLRDFSSLESAAPDMSITQ